MGPGKAWFRVLPVVNEVALVVVAICRRHRGGIAGLATLTSVRSLSGAPLHGF